MLKQISQLRKKRISAITFGFCALVILLLCCAVTAYQVKDMPDWQLWSPYDHEQYLNPLFEYLAGHDVQGSQAWWFHARWHEVEEILRLHLAVDDKDSSWFDNYRQLLYCQTEVRYVGTPLQLKENPDFVKCHPASVPKIKALKDFLAGEEATLAGSWWYHCNVFAVFGAVAEAFKDDPRTIMGALFNDGKIIIRWHLQPLLPRERGQEPAPNVA
jgi:hypothetical protein